MGLHMSETERDALYLGIGRITAEWGAIDFCLDALVDIIDRHFGAPDTAFDFPRSLRQKVRFVRAAFNRIAALRAVADDGKSLLRRISALSHKRHRVAHAMVLESFGANPNFAEGYRLVFSTFQERARGVQHEPTAVADLDRTADEIRDLMLEVNNFYLRVVDVVFWQRQREPSQQSALPPP
jgi:hypothetical protein